MAAMWLLCKQKLFWMWQLMSGSLTHLTRVPSNGMLNLPLYVFTSGCALL